VVLSCKRGHERASLRDRYLPPAAASERSTIRTSPAYGRLLRALGDPPGAARQTLPAAPVDALASLDGLVTIGPGSGARLVKGAPGGAAYLTPSTVCAPGRL
jgi:hypothetical protein